MNRKIKEHLKSRYLDYSKYHCFLSDKEFCCTFLLFNLSGKLVGYQKYSPNAEKTHQRFSIDGNVKYLSHSLKDTHAVWGLERFNFKKELLFITEGVFDACRLHNLGFNAIATLSNNPKKLKSFFNCLPQKRIVFCDGDKAGIKLKKFGHMSHVLPDGKDLGDMRDEEIRGIITGLFYEEIFS